MNGGLTYVEMDRRKDSAQRLEIALQLIQREMEKPQPPATRTLLPALQATLGK